MNFITDFGGTLLGTCRDILPILLLIILFQFFVLRQKIPNPGRLILGGIYVVLGLALFLAGLERLCFHWGRSWRHNYLTLPLFMTQK